MDRKKESIELEAAEWFATIQEPELSGEQLLAWEEWMSSSSEHLQAFSRYQDLYKRMNQLEEIPLPDEAEMTADDYDGSESISEWLAKQSPTTAKVVPYPAKKRNSIWLPTASAAAIILAVLLFALIPERGHLPEVQVYETTVAQQREITLDDGSQITIGAKSGISVNYSEQQRNVVLTHGEALFNVVSDSDRPFVVMAGKGNITVLGTLFNVNRNSKRTQVTVAEGRVQVVSHLNGDVPGNTPAQSAILERGEQVGYTMEGQMGEITSIESGMADWKKGYWRYRREPLQSVIEDINRYSRKEIILVGSNAEMLMFTGTVHQNQLEEWLSGVIDIYKLEVSEAGDKAIILRKRQ
ncbi:FecR domain-containing protein [Porticoccaceae bacterium LTM1]|nr:FecR domain-containing protein [Porticoccaceae bacterium LTM1]